MRIAKFKSIEYGFITIASSIYEEEETYIRISEYVDVDFPMIDTAEQVKSELAVLDMQEKKIMAAAASKIEEIHKRKKDLLALPYLKEAS